MQQHLLHLLNNISDARILCMGDIMLDRFIYGEVNRISPEAPIPVIKIAREKEMLGGVGNVVANITSLGAKTSILSIVGDDEVAKKISNKLYAIGVCDKGLIIDSSRPTSLKTRFISSGQQLLRTDMEDTKIISDNLTNIIYDKFTSMSDEFDIVVISDYGKGAICSKLLAKIIKSGKKVIIDPKGHDYSIYRDAYLITPNKKELSEASSMPTSTDDDVIEAAKYLIKKFNIQNILATRSKDGMTIVSSDGYIKHIRAQAKEVFDVSGAGDSVVAAISVLLASGANLTEAAEIANIAGSIVVGKVGTATVGIDEVKEYISSSSVLENTFCDKITTKEMVERWRQKNLKLGFTNGCFDLIHPGHISLLKQAKSKCDKLIVGLNSDNSVKRLKGKDRPVQNEISRAMVLKAISYVDIVVIFEEDTPMELLQELQPDILIKGGDYSMSEVVGADFVMSYGGEVFLADLKEGQSTTNMIKRSAQ